MQTVVQKIKNLNLQWKLLIPIVTVIVVLMSALGIYNISQIRGMLLEVEQQNMQGMVDDVVESLHIADFGYEMLEQEGEDNNLAMARAVADLVESDSDYLEQENMEELANRLGVDEIYVTDEEGVIQYGTDPEIFGLDFSENEQTRPFLDIIENPDMELAQEPVERAADSQLFQYVGVARQDQPGIVQVGMSGETLEEMSATMDSQIDQLITEAEIGEGGYMFIMDDTGEIHHHPDDPLIGRQHPDDELVNNIFDHNSGEITRTVRGNEEFTVFEQWEDMYVAATIDTDEFLAPVNNLRTQLFGVLVVMLILILAIIVLVIRKAVIAPVREIQSKITSLGEGDLNAQISRDSNDEVGIIGQNFNKAVTNIRNMIDTITSQTDKLNHSSEELASSVEETSASVQEVSKTMEDLAKGATQQSEEANNSKEKLDELSTLITETVSYSDSVAENSGQIKEVTQRSKDSLGELKSNYNKTAEIITSINDKVSDLNQSSEQIGEIVDQIKSVAEQTNLLALNASIEAARAGEHGQGFSVVANEIRKLAEETSNSMGDIEEITTKIREKITEANNETEQSQPLAKKVEEATEEVESSFDENIETLEGITKQIEELAQNIRSVDEHKDEVVGSISNIASITQESSAATQEVSASVEEQSTTLDQLASLSEQLNQIAHELHDQIQIFNK